MLDPQFFLISDDPSSIRPIPELHRYIAKAPVLTMCDSTWLVADALGKLQRVFADSSATVTPDYDGLDGVVNPTVNSNGVTPPSIVATLMYSDTARSVEFSSQMDEPETLDETIGRIDHHPVCLRGFQDGSRVVVYTDEVLHQASHSAPWTRVYSFTPRLNSAAIPFMNSPTPLLVSNGGNRLHYGTSSGTQWSSSVLRGVRSAISALQSSGNIVAFKSADKIHLLELTGGQDTITGNVFTCGYLKPFAFLSVSDSVVSFAALSSSTDGSPNYTTADRIAYTTWNAADSTVDSVIVNISPVKLGVYKQEYICSLHDTAFVYSHEIL